MFDTRGRRGVVFTLVAIISACSGGDDSSSPGGGKSDTADAGNQSGCPTNMGTGCDPLTQCGGGPSPAACGSSDPANPTKGCYGYAEYTCADVPPIALDLTDRKAALTDPMTGDPFLNGCAPGFVPLFFESTTSMKVVCSGMCAALDTDNTTPQNAKGDPAASGKLPREAGLAAGNATCEIGKKGSDASSVCSFLWPFLVDPTTSTLPATFEPFAGKIGVCMAVAHYQYDSNGDMTPDKTVPSCATLPPPSAATTGVDDDAADWGCYSPTKMAPRRAPNATAMIDRVRVGTFAGHVPLGAHVLE